MQFDSLFFLIYSLFVVIIYYSLPIKYRWISLLISSYAFFLFSCPTGFIFIIITTVISFVCGRLMSGLSRGKKQKYLVISLVAPVLVFLTGKCFAEFFYNAPQLFVFEQSGVNIDFLIPIGVSFYVLQSMGYVIDVYRGTVVSDNNIAKYALFVSFFPHIIQGPVSRHRELADQLYVGHRFNYRQVAFGAQLMLWGMVKRVVIANRLQVFTDKVFDSEGEYTGFFILIAVVLYAVQLYADLSGGVDIARGLSQMVGVELPENFKRPFFSTSVSEFWNRWNVTVTRWFKDYVYTPVVNFRFGNVFFLVIAEIVSFTALGLWHGIGPSYVLFGLYQAVFVIMGIFLGSVVEKIIDLLRINCDAFSWRVIRIFKTSVLIVLGMIFPASGDWEGLCYALKGICAFNPEIFFDGSLLTMGLVKADFAVLIPALILWLCVSISNEIGISVRQKLAEQNMLCRWAVYIIGICSVFVLGVYGA